MSLTIFNPKRSLCLALLLSAATAAVGGQTAGNSKAVAGTPTAAGYSLTITPPPSPIHLGAAIEITIITTVGNHDIWWRSEKGNTAYHAFLVHLTKSGHDVAKTRFHRSLINELRPDEVVPEDLGESSVVFDLKPRTSFDMKVNLMRLYEITEPGSYVVSVTRYDENTKTTVRSNTVTLNILK